MVIIITIIINIAIVLMIKTSNDEFTNHDREFQDWYVNKGGKEEIEHETANYDEDEATKKDVENTRKFIDWYFNKGGKEEIERGDYK